MNQESQQLPTISEDSPLHRKLNARLLNMIAIGGSIGTGIFLASGNVIYTVGPGGTLLAYVIISVMVFFLMTSLGEMAALLPTSGSFYHYGAQFVDPAFGYALGWNYWFNWAITVASEISAATLIMHYWWPESSTLMWSAGFITFFVAFNAFSVRGFAEAEYWFSMIKVTTIIVFLIIGAVLISGAGTTHPGGFHNWVIDGGPFKGNWLALFGAFIVAGYSFQGTELIGVAAGESSNPQENIPKAVRHIFWRILLFFVLSILVISLLIPHNSPELAQGSVEVSPFTLVFKQLGITFAATLMNAVILTAILSAGNSGMYASTRMLWFLAKEGHVPRIFTKVNKHGVPIPALIATTLVAMLAFLSSFFGNGVVYFWLVNASSLCGFIAWAGIAVSHYRFRKAYLLQGRDLKDLPYVAKGYPFAPIFACALCIIIIAGQNIQAFMGDKINWYGIAVSYSTIPLFLLFWLGYKFKHKTKLVDLHQCDFKIH